MSEVDSLYAIKILLHSMSVVDDGHCTFQVQVISQEIFIFHCQINRVEFSILYVA